MPLLEIWLLILMVLGLAVGGWGILWARAREHTGRAFWGRVLFVAALLSQGLSGIVAAFHRADGLVPLGLTAGFLVVGMLWDWSPSAPSQSMAEASRD